VDDLHAVLARLAASSDEQLAYLRQLGAGDSADELALELADLTPLLPRLVGERQVSRRQADAIQLVDGKLAAMGDTPGLWRSAALREDPAWAEVRRLAAAALRASVSDRPASTTR
jgi:hypothetical protein